MARIIKPLTEKEIRTAKPKVKRYKMLDGQGLFLLVKPSGSKGWRLKYRYYGKEKQLSLGPYDVFDSLWSSMADVTYKKQHEYSPLRRPLWAVIHDFARISHFGDDGSRIGNGGY